MPENTPVTIPPAKKDRITTALLAFFLGAFGVHKFYLGYQREGLIMLLVTIIGTPACGLGPAIIEIVAFVEFIIYLMKSDDEFQEIYVNNKHPWF